MDIAADIAATATMMKQAQVQSAASTLMLKKTMNSEEQIATQLIDQMSQLSVGYAEPHAVDVSI